MMRLVAYSTNGIERIPLRELGEVVIGSGRGCDLRLRGEGIESRHAVLRHHRQGFEIRRVGERGSLEVNGRAVSSAKLKPLDEIRLGKVLLVLDDIDWSEPAGEVPEPAPAAAPLIAEPPADIALSTLGRVSDWVVGDYSSHRSLESILTEALAHFGGGVFLLYLAHSDRWVIKFSTSTRAAWMAESERLAREAREALEGAVPHESSVFATQLGNLAASACTSEIHALDRRYLVLAAFPRLQETEVSGRVAAAVRALGNLVILGLVHHVGHFEPILPGKQDEAALTLAPGLVLGESRSSELLLERMRQVAARPEPVLLLGEAGSEMEAVARSLHLSGARPDGPFVSLLCHGADTIQIDSDLFGAEVEGKRGRLRRAGRLSEAGGGTLLLEEVSQLPLELQGKLVRLLRHGEIAARGVAQTEEADVRIVATSSAPLEPLAADGRMRPDLAWLLTRMIVRVPALRERREDLPLLVQWLTNRFCHETGKRLLGISMKAMAALVRYDYPGNLDELEGVVREMVYACPTGRPVHLEYLPPKLREGGPAVSVELPGEESELTLSPLVQRLETAAIREALRRTDGNRAAAARLLGISRNGLAQKMKRYRIQVTGGPR